MMGLSQNGIILDNGYFSCILNQASKEGFIRSRKNPWWKLFERVTPAKTKIALRMLLLYGKVVYPDIYLNSPEEIWNIYEDVLENKLTKEGLLEITSRNTVLSTNEPTVAEHIVDCIALKEFLLSSKEKRRRCFDPFNFGWLRSYHSQDYYEKRFEFTLALLGLISHPTDTITTLMNRIEPEAEKHEYYKDNLVDFLEKGVGCITSDTGRELCYSLFANSFGQWWSATSGIIRQGEHLANLLYYSDRQSLPTFVSDINARKTSFKNLKQLEDKPFVHGWNQFMQGLVLSDGYQDIPIPSDIVSTPTTYINDLEQLEDNLSKTESSHIALGVFFDEEVRPVLPVVSSIADVLRLREDRRIRDFRGKISQWAEALKTGEANLIDLKKELTDANRKIKTIGEWEKVSTWVTFFSLPVDVALALSGFGLPISTMTSAISFGVASVSKLLKRNYNWYMFGIK